MAVTPIGERIRQVARKALPKSVYLGCASLLDGWYGVQEFGLDDYKRLLAIGKGPAGGAPSEVQLRSLAHPLYLRPGTPDASVVIHAMAREAYGYRLPARPVHLIVDAGANIGDTSVWYYKRFPESSVVAIEPNPDNLAILTKNCGPYCDRIRVLNAALWPVPDRLMAISGALAGTEVHESEASDDLECASIDPLTILRDSGCDVIDIFKIDIEGAELPLFSGECDSWLQKTRSIAIEIHSEEALNAVLTATKRNGFKYAIYRDLYFFWK